MNSNMQYGVHKPHKNADSLSHSGKIFVHQVPITAGEAGAAWSEKFDLESSALSTRTLPCAERR